MDRRTVVLTNDFHQTSVALRGEALPGGEMHLSARQVKRAGLELCCSDCRCSGETGARGHQHWAFIYTQSDRDNGGLTLSPLLK